ncbi:hypothetical protein MTR_2g041990 [Medicago truncatula]|uniref:Transmembrane protein n=1 Tax=Medicago truncatula TaxID=3880 RepID=G7IGD0_MEDTR|nr:hypothetical protein MTR_2g041990 [Medicago truncatula]
MSFRKPRHCWSVALLLWQIWAARNDVIWNDVHHTSTKVHKHHSPPVVQHGQNRVQVWKKPNETWLKCNVDATFHERNHITSFLGLFYPGAGVVNSLPCTILGSATKRLKEKIAFNHLNSISRCLRSLTAAGYLEDRVHLHVNFAHFPLSNNSDIDLKLRNVGLQARWVEAWWPGSDD